MEPQPSWTVHEIARGEALGTILPRYGLPTTSVLDAARPHHDLAKLQAGQNLRFLTPPGGDSPTEVHYKLGMDETLVVWAGEFGRTVYSQGELTATNYGRDHHPRCFTVWMAGGGIQPGITYGRTDDYSYNIVENPVEVHDLHATMLNQLGLDHEKIVYRHQGRDYRLTDVHGRVVRDLIT